MPAQAGDRQPVPFTREEALEHADADRRVLDADVRYADAQALWHRRLIRALRPYGDRGTFAGLVVAAVEARDGSAAV